MMYLAIEIYPPVDPDAPANEIKGYPSHNVIATHEEMALHMADYRGHVHIITGFYTAEQVAGMSYTDRGLASLDEGGAD